jgi:putative glutathione S-transferase
VAQTVNFNHIVRHYYYSHESINPNRIIPINPQADWAAPHGRGVQSLSRLTSDISLPTNRETL